MPTLIVLGFLALIIPALWLHARSNVRLANRHMAGRPALTPAELGDHYFPPDQAHIAAKLRELLAAEIVVDLARLHPDDRPVQDLRIDELDSLALAEVMMDAEREFHIKLPDGRLRDIRTFRELVELIADESKRAGTA